MNIKPQTTILEPDTLYGSAKVDPELCFKCMFHDGEGLDFNFKDWVYIYNDNVFTEPTPEFIELVDKILFR